MENIQKKPYNIYMFILNRSEQDLNRMLVQNKQIIMVDLYLVCNFKDETH